MLTTSAVAVAAIALIIVGVLLGPVLGTSSDDVPNAPDRVAQTVTERRVRQADVDLGREALALLPHGITVSRAQSTRERRCLDDGDYEPCAEFSVDAFGPGDDRRRSYEQRARANGWRVVRSDAGQETLRLARGTLQARIILTSYGYDRVRVSDPTQRRPVAEPVAVAPASARAARAPFVAAAERTCKRLNTTIATAPAAGTSSNEIFSKLIVGFEAFVAEVKKLPVPPGDESAVRRLRTELRNYARVLRMLQTAEEGQALAAAAGIVVQGNRAEDAMRQYGLRACKGITGVPKR